MSFVGHTEVFEDLCKLAVTDKVGHAYLFTGKSGIGKRLLAIEFAKAMMCFHPTKDGACGSCEACKVFQKGLDFDVIEPEKNMIKVDAIRELSEKVYLKPTSSKRKCFIINDADLMNESAQNALLKVLEEPPLYATLVLVSANKQNLLKTIQSRTTEIAFQALSDAEMKMVLGDTIDAQILPYARGSVEKALKLLNDNDIRQANDVIQIFETKDFLTLTKKIEELKNDKDNISNLLEMMEKVCFQKIHEDTPEYIRWINVIEQTNQRILRNGNVDLALDNMAIEVCFG